MTPSLSLILPLLLSTATTITAFPIVPRDLKTLSKRSTTAHKVGLGFGITISILIFAIIIFYLGVRRGRAGSWFCWREPAVLPTTRSPTSLSEKISVVDPDQLKSRISFPLASHSSALPELSPVEAHHKHTPKFLELSASEAVIYEMGQPSPKRPTSVHSSNSSMRKSGFSIATRTTRKSYRSTFRKSYFSAYRKSRATTPPIPVPMPMPPNHARQSYSDRKSWFCRSAQEVENEERKLREKSSCDSLDSQLPAYPGPVFVMIRDEDDKRASDASEGMDWTGMEWLRRVYGRKSGVTLGRKSGISLGRKSLFRSLYFGGEEKRDGNGDRV